MLISRSLQFPEKPPQSGPTGPPRTLRLKVRGPGTGPCFLRGPAENLAWSEKELLTSYPPPSPLLVQFLECSFKQRSVTLKLTTFKQLPIVLRVMTKDLTRVSETLPDWPLWPLWPHLLPFCPALAILASQLFLKHTRHTPFSGSWHLLIHLFAGGLSDLPAAPFLTSFGSLLQSPPQTGLSI